MDNYNEELKKYLEELKDKGAILANMHPNADMSPELYNQLIYNPKDVLEINVARGLISLCESFLNLVDDVVYDRAVEIDPHDTKFVKFYGELIQRLKNNEDYSDIMIAEDDYETIIDLLLEATVCGMEDSEKFTDALIESSGYAPDDEDSILEFQVFFNRANAIMNTKKKEELTEENKKKFVEFANLFKNKCESLKKENAKGLKKKKDKE